MRDAPGPDTTQPEASCDRGTLRRVLDRLNVAAAVFVVAEVVEVPSGTLIFGYVSEVGRSQPTYAPVVIRCQAAVCPVPAGQRLRVWVDEDGAHLEHCLP